MNSETRVPTETRVPSEMIKWVIRSRYGTADPTQARQIEKDLEVALRWLEPRLVKNIIEKGECYGSILGGWEPFAQDIVRRMFRSEVNVPEALKALLTCDSLMVDPVNHNAAILEAYRLGQKSRKTK